MTYFALGLEFQLHFCYSGIRLLRETATVTAVYDGNTSSLLRLLASIHIAVAIVHLYLRPVGERRLHITRDVIGAVWHIRSSRGKSSGR